MELPKVVNNPLSSFHVQDKQIKHPNTPLIQKPFLHPNLNSSPKYSIHFKSKVKVQNPNEISISGIQKKPHEEIPTMSEIMESSRLQNLDIQVKGFGPFFRICAKSLESGRELGRLEGIIRVWIGGKILHLDSMRLQRETIGMKKSIFGIGLFLGAVAIRYGYERGCIKAELLAINDSDLYHAKLVRFYNRLGFRKVYEVKGESLGDMVHMLVWGGVGTRMDANLQHLMIKWCSRFKPSI